MVGPRSLQGESLETFNEGIGYILNRWEALRTAVYYQWGGKNSHLYAEKLIADVRCWFNQSEEPLCIDELKFIINEEMDAAFDLQIRDGSDGDIVGELMIMREECLDGDFRTVEQLREASRTENFYPRVEKLTGCCPEEFERGNNHRSESITQDGTYSNECSIEDDSWGSMDLDIPKPESSSDSVNKPN